MKTKHHDFSTIFFLFWLLFTVYCQGKVFGQEDTPNTTKSVSDSKIQLLEYNQKILEAKLELLETKVQLKENSNKKQSELQKQFIGIQNNEVSEDTTLKPFTQAICFSLNRIFEGTMQLSYEKAIKKNISLDFSILGTYVTKEGFGRGYLESQQFAYSDAATNSYIYFNGNMLRSIGGMFRLKNYLLTRVNAHSKAPVGLYAAPQLMYRRVWVTGNQYIYDYYFAPSKEITRNLDIMQGGVILGSKFTLAKVLCVDVYLGGVMRLSKYYNEKTFTKYKRWHNIDYSGILPTAGINIGILK